MTQRTPDLTIILDDGERIEIYVSPIGWSLIAAVVFALELALFHTRSAFWFVVGFSHVYLFYGCLMKFYFVLLDQRLRKLTTGVS